MSTKSVTVTGDDVTVSKVIWQALRRQPAGYIDVVLARNPGLAELGPFLPVGTVVVLPLDEVPTAAAERPLVRLWD